MNRHTPGPWRVEDPLGPDILSIVAGSESPAEWVDVAQLSTDGSEIDPRESAANAAMLAAAPELADALEDLLSGCTDTFCEFCGKHAPQVSGPLNLRDFALANDPVRFGPIPHKEDCPAEAARAALRKAGRLP